MSLSSLKLKTIKRITPSNEQWFFGYYDIPAVSPSGSMHLALKAPFGDRLPGPSDLAQLYVIDTENLERHRIAETRTWNFQQGCLAQWLSDRSSKVIFNDFNPSNGEFISRIVDLSNGSERLLNRPVATVSKDGKWALSVNFSRLHDFRPGYGYANKADLLKKTNQPAEDGVHLINLETGEDRLTLSLQQIFHHICNDSPFSQQKLLVNHITFNPSGKRFLMLVRNFPLSNDQGEWRTWLITVNREGNEMKTLIRSNYVSHYNWKSDTTVAFYSSGPLGNQLYEIDTEEERFTAVDLDFFRSDGHCSYDPKRRYMLYDSYPDETGLQRLYLYDLKKKKGNILTRLKSIPTENIDTRCDLHPRWLPCGKRISFDSTHEGYRAIYLSELGQVVAS